MQVSGASEAKPGCAWWQMHCAHGLLKGFQQRGAQRKYPRPLAAQEKVTASAYTAS